MANAPTALEVPQGQSLHQQSHSSAPSSAPHEDDVAELPLLQHAQGAPKTPNLSADKDEQMQDAPEQPGKTQAGLAVPPVRESRAKRRTMTQDFVSALAQDDGQPKRRGRMTAIADFVVEVGANEAGHRSTWIMKILESNKFTLSVTALIILNAVYIGIETDKNADGQGGPMWFAVELTFAVLFSAELMLRIAGLGVYFFRDAWNIFDMVLVLLAVVDAFILGMVSAMNDDGQSENQLGVFSAMRIARLMRLARILRLLRFFKELWLLVSGIVNSIRTLAWAWLLILLIIYIFGILVTRMLGQDYGCRLGSRPNCDPEMDVYFGTVPRSMFTFFQMITTEGWADIARASMKHVSSMWAVFILFMSITTFAMMNVVIAVIVDNTLEQAEGRRKEITKKLDRDRSSAMEKIYEVFCITDKDGDKLVSREEFLVALKNPEVMRNLHGVEIDMRGAEGLFDILDYDDSGQLDVTEFIEGCMRARGGAKAKDVLALQCDLWRTQQDVTVELQSLQDLMSRRFKRLDEELKPLRMRFMKDEVGEDPTAPLMDCSPVKGQGAAAPLPIGFSSKNRGKHLQSKPSTIESGGGLPGAAAAT